MVRLRSPELRSGVETDATSKAYELDKADLEGDWILEVDGASLAACSTLSFTLRDGVISSATAPNGNYQMNGSLVLVDLGTDTNDCGQRYTSSLMLSLPPNFNASTSQIPVRCLTILEDDDGPLDMQVVGRFVRATGSGLAN